MSGPTKDLSHEAWKILDACRDDAGTGEKGTRVMFGFEALHSAVSGLLERIDTARDEERAKVEREIAAHVRQGVLLRKPLGQMVSEIERGEYRRGQP